MIVFGSLLLMFNAKWINFYVDEKLSLEAIFLSVLLRNALPRCTTPNKETFYSTREAGIPMNIAQDYSHHTISIQLLCTRVIPTFSSYFRTDS